MKKFGYLLSVMMFCGGCLFGCGNANNVEEVKEPQQVQTTHEETESVKEAREQTEQQQEEQQEQEQKEIKTPVIETPQLYRFGLNETVPMTTTYGDYEITFTDAYFTDERNQFSDKQADKVLIIVYEYKNVSYVPDYTDGLFICEGLHYQLYGEDGFSLETYPVSLPYYQDTVSVGRSSKGSEVFAVVGDQHHFEIELGSNVIVEFDVE